MASRSIRVEFVHDNYDATEVASPAEVHDVSIPEDVDGVPRVLENPHVDFPGTWVLEEDAAGARDEAREAGYGDRGVPVGATSDGTVDDDFRDSGVREDADLREGVGSGLHEGRSGGAHAAGLRQEDDHGHHDHDHDGHRGRDCDVHRYRKVSEVADTSGTAAG